MPTPIIGIVTPLGMVPDKPLFDWLAALFPVRFQNCQPGCFDGVDAVIFLGGTDAVRGLPSLQIPAPAKANLSSSAVTVQFGQGLAVPKEFRGRAVQQTNLGSPASLHSQTGDQILATSEGQPIWVVREDGICRTDFVALAPPLPDETSKNFSYFEARNFVALLPVVDFLRRLTGQSEWSSPGLRACFMFDDPNLHSTRYGCINYQEMAQHAHRHNYHAAMATIPIDGWYADRGAVGVFMENQARLSLLMHGNDHLDKELASFTSDEQRLGALAQALQRISRLEAKTSIKVSKVMAAPHGACSEETLALMARLGFEAACISHSALRSYNSDKAWAKSVGLGMSEFVAGLPVIPRFRVSYQCHNSVLLSAYLDQPIIPVGHHQDVAGSLDLLGGLADFINSLGQVSWVDMAGIARSNYQTRKEGSLLQVRSVARMLHLMVPPGVTQVSIHGPNSSEAAAKGIRIRAPGQADQILSHYVGEPFSIQPETSLEITSFAQNQIDPGSVRQPKLRIWPFARRVLTEGRDRLHPLAGSLKKMVRQNGAQKS